MIVNDSSLRGLLTEILSPYGGAGGRTILIEGEDVSIDDRGATPLALIFHELATNSAKYGALSAEGSSVRLSSRHEGDKLRIEWVERGGPSIKSPPQRSGFGSRLVEISVEQLGGSIERRWDSEGLVAELTVLPERLRR